MRCLNQILYPSFNYKTPKKTPTLLKLWRLHSCMLNPYTHVKGFTTPQTKHHGDKANLFLVFKRCKVASKNYGKKLMLCLGKLMKTYDLCLYQSQLLYLSDKVQITNAGRHLWRTINTVEYWQAWIIKILYLILW